MIDKKHILALAAFLGLTAVATAGDIPLDPTAPYQGVRSNPVTYKVDFAAVVTPPYKCKTLKIWLPIPPSDSIQTVSASALSSFPLNVEPKRGRETLYGNEFAYFEFHEPQGAQMVRHQFTIKTHDVHWNLDPDKVAPVARWPAAFAPYLRSEELVPVDERFKKVAGDIVPRPTSPSRDFARIFDWVNTNLAYSHKDSSLQGSAVHALEKRGGHCSDYHGLCTSFGRSLGYPSRIVYGINPYPKNSPSHCKLEVFLPGQGWVCYDVSETQQMIARIQKNEALSDTRKVELTAAAKKRLTSGFRDRTWFLQTRGSGYDLEPPAKNKVAVVRTIYAEADGVPYPEPDPANPGMHPLSWMTMHRYEADRPVTNPFQDERSLAK